MRKCSTVIRLFLSLLIVFQLMPTAVHAEDQPEEGSSDQEEVVEVSITENTVVTGVRQILRDIETVILRMYGQNRVERLNDQLSALIHNYLAESQINTDLVGIKIESLNGLFHFELNSQEEFIAASLYKAPLAVVYYDAVNEGDLELDDTLYYSSYMYEEGGPIGSNYDPGDSIELEELLHDMIQYSDNTAGHILYESLGGWPEYKETIRYLAEDYSDNPSYLSYDNIQTPAFMNQVMLHIAENKDDYTLMIEDMVDSQPEHYLNRNESYGIAQKYGEISGVENASGFCLDVNCPYAITIMTANWQGEKWIGDISEIVHRFFSNIP